MRLALFAVLFAASLAQGQLLAPTAPEAQGVNSAGVQAFVEAFEKEVDAPHGFVLVRHGHPIAAGWWAPYDRATPHMLYSLSKSFTSTAIGLLSDDGKLDVDNAVLPYFPDDAPKDPDANLRAMRIRDLLTMNSGHDKDTLARVTLAGNDNWVQTYLSFPVEHPPGTHFVYNTGNTYMLSAIVEKITGQSVLDFLKPRLFEPLGIANPTWETDPRGIDTGGWGLSITTEDIARFGQLYLQHGMWDGKRLLSESWISLASAPQTPNGTNPNSDWNQGYGFQFWRCRHNCYRGDGAFGQYCIVMPDLDAVLAINGGQGDMQRTLNLVWDHLLPAMHDAPLPADDAAAEALSKKLASLHHAPVSGEANSPHIAKITGNTYIFDANKAGLKSVTFAFDGDTRRIVLDTEHGQERFDVGYGKWEKQTVSFYQLGIPAAASTGPQTVAASAAWAKPDQLVARAWITTTPYRIDMTFDFDAEANALAMAARIYPLQGQMTTFKASAK
ncbi:MAG: serine hydrolase [Planctomycetes bacterium]|nr:serine hydrolase [Planctomycetota bacterium]